MEIKTTRIHQVWLVRFDEIPLTKLLTSTILQERFTALFEFRNNRVIYGEKGDASIQAQAGIWRSEHDGYPILSLVLEQRRILIDVEGPSEIADQVIAKLREFLTEITGRSEEKFLQPIVKAEESEIIARLGFTVDKLIPAALMDFVSSALTGATRLEVAETTVKPLQLTFLVQYHPNDLLLDDYRISLVRKEFIIGARPGYPLEDQIFYSKAPVSTGVHIQLLEQLEQILSHSS